MKHVVVLENFHNKMSQKTSNHYEYKYASTLLSMSINKYQSRKITKQNHVANNHKDKFTIV